MNKEDLGYGVMLAGAWRCKALSTNSGQARVWSIPILLVPSLG